MEIGKKIISLRKQRGWTQYRLFKEAGISQSNLSRIEGGSLCPSYKQLCKLASALNVSVQVFESPNNTRKAEKPTELNTEQKDLLAKILDMPKDETFEIIAITIQQIKNLPADYQKALAKIIDSLRP